MSFGSDSRPKISILSAVWNEAAYVAEMITSVQSQDLGEWELLFVDDGSTDNTVAIIGEYAARDPRIRLVSHGAKIGKVKAFNVAFSAGKGDVIVLLAGDDRIPPESLRARYQAMASLPRHVPAVAYFKIRTFSEENKFHDMVLPRGSAGSRSGGSLTMNRVLAESLFPIEETLVSEDIWLGYGSEFLASSVIDRSEVVLEYRIHAGNSNPRNRAFDDMTESIHQRHRAWQRLAETEQLPLAPEARQRLADMWAAEQLRHDGRVVALATFRALPSIERIALLSMAHPALFALRTLFYKFFSGRRNK